MINRILLVVVCLQSLILVFMGSSENTTLFNEEKTDNNKIEEPIEIATNTTINVKDTKTNEISNLDLEDYIIGVVAGEMPASFNEEALKAQAVAARTYALYKMKNSNGEYDVVTDVSNQCYITIDDMQDKWGNEFSKYYEKIKQAVLDTKGEILTYDGKVIEAFYFAMSNGYTENSELVFNESFDYLKSVPSTYDEKVKDFNVTKTFSEKKICEALDLNCNEVTINDIKRSETGRVLTIKINDKEFNGDIVRSELGLRSTDFEIKKENNEIKITTKGFGHGVGMSQYGAQGMAIDGNTYEEILKYFYQNVEIEKI